MKNNDSMTSRGLVSLDIGQQATAHCTLAAQVAVGKRAVTKDGHIVERTSQTEWVVVGECEQGDGKAKRYERGVIVKGRVLFWKMNGLAGLLSSEFGVQA